MKKNLSLFVFYLMGIITLQSSSCSNVKELEYKGIKNTKLQTLNMNNASLKIDIEYFNPNNFGLDVKETNLNVYINEQFIALADQPTKTQIPKSALFIFPVVVHFDPKKMVGLALKNVFSKTVKLRMQGTAKLGKQGVFMKIPVDISEDVALDFK